jgi:hypothetical protein
VWMSYCDKNETGWSLSNVFRVDQFAKEICHCDKMSNGGRSSCADELKILVDRIDEHGL